MDSRPKHFCMLGGAFLFLAAFFSSQAAAVNYSSEWQGSSGLLPDAACPAWQLTDSANPENPSSGGGILTLATSAVDENIFYQQLAPEIAMTFPVVMEYRVRFLSGVSTRNNRAPVGAFLTTAPSVGGSVFVGLDEVFIAGAGTSRQSTISVDTNDTFHTYRIEVAASGVMDVYYDGNHLLTGSTFASASDHGASQRVGWGEGSISTFGVSEWTFFRHNGHASGCPPRYNSTWCATLDLLPDAACPAWQFTDSATPENPSLGGGFLTLSTSSVGENMFYQQLAPEIAMTFPVVMEYRVRFVSGASTQSNRAPVVAYITTAPSVGGSVFVGLDEVFIEGVGTSRQATALVDTNDTFHTYRIEVAASGAMDVYYDGNPLLTGSTFASASDHGSTPRIGWGEASIRASGVSEWECFRHNAHATDCDQDGDGSRIETDCDDVDSCTNSGAQEICDLKDNDCDGSIDEGTLFPPGVTRGLRMLPDKISLTWAACGGNSVAYDVVKGDVSSLASTGGDYEASVLACLENNSPDTASSDQLPTPPSGDGFFYVVRTVSVCGAGSYDSGFLSQIDSRDEEIAANGNACP